MIADPPPWPGHRAISAPDFKSWVDALRFYDYAPAEWCDWLEHAVGPAVGGAAEGPVTLWKWWIVDERTGKRRLTSYRMTEADALERHPGAEREESSREERHPLVGTMASIVTRGR